MANRLAHALSPYLRQHASNPVDWREWGPEAFAEARDREVPILLSVGYAACHWCHVMAHESFDDAVVAETLNDGYVAIKVDREERPDIDAAYMAATTAMTGHGGWPMTCLLTPGGQPFFAGTYLPKQQFLDLLSQVSALWADRREEVVASGANITAQLQNLSRPAVPVALNAFALDEAAAALASGFDQLHGGFGGAPKFPPSMVLRFLLRQASRTGSTRSRTMVDRTCDAMARGGMYDQLGGGFARYAVDSAWVVPHFEKMLFDNGLLLSAYAEWWRQSPSPLGRRVVEETAEFLLRDLRTEQGAFASALDADADGVEGATYAWTPGQLRDVLGVEDGDRAASLLSVTTAGTFEHGSSTLQLRADAQDARWWAETRRRLWQARQERPQPARDDKIVTSWNGLAIAGLALAGRLLDRRDLIAAAKDCGSFLLATHVVDGRLRRVSFEGSVGSAPGMADDYGNLAEGLSLLYQVTGDAQWLEAAEELAEVALIAFRAEDGTWTEVPRDGERLFLQPPGGADNAEPSGLSALAGAFITCSALTGSPALRAAGDSALAANSSPARRNPRFGGWTLAVAEAALAGPLQVAVIGADDEATAMRAVAFGSHSPGLVVAHAPAPVGPDGPALLRDRPFVDGRSAAYVCRGFVCGLPVTTADELVASV